MDPRVQVLQQKLGGFTWKGSHGMALCPCHDDKHPSLSIEVAVDGKLLMHCHGCNADGPQVLRAVGLDLGLLRDASTESSTGTPATSGLSLAQYADAKRLDIGFLRKLGVTEQKAGPRAFVEIPYKDLNGKVVAVRKRLTLTGDKRFIWRKGDKPCLYGLDRLASYDKSAPILLVEGESDSQTAWQVGLQAVGVPGASTFHDEWSQALDGFVDIVLVQEPDAGGETLLEAVASTSLADRLRVVKLPEAKDLSELYVRDREGFTSAVMDAIGSATRTVRRDPMRLSRNWGWRPEKVDVSQLMEDLLPIGEFLEVPADEAQWIVQDLIPAGGITVFGAKPKKGKSTLARTLVRAVCKGVPFLGRETKQGSVVLVALEDKTWELQRSLKDLGLDKSDQLYVMNRQMTLAPDDSMEYLCRVADLHRPDLIIIDPLFDFMRASDVNEYGAMQALFQPLKAFARQTGIALLLCHHNRKSDSGTGGDGLLGSTSIFGALDTSILLTEENGRRYVHSEHRYGQPIDKHVLVLQEDGSLDLGEVAKPLNGAELERKVLAFFALHPGSSKQEARCELRVSAQRLAKAVEELVERGDLIVSGTGTKGKPFTFRAARQLELF